MIDLETFPEFRWIAAGVFGLFIGSFLNVAIHRLPLEGQSVSHPRRSQCPRCKRMLRWYENIPVFSFALQGGKCRGCAGAISWRYPLVELLTAVLWAGVAYVTPQQEWGLLFVRLLIVSSLIVVTFIDFAYFEIPDEISIGGMFVAPVLALLVPEIHRSTGVALYFSGGEPVGRIDSLIACLAGMAAGGGVLWVMGWLGKLIFKREAMGFGDVKLLAAAGGFIGPVGVGIALLLASMVASVSGVGNMVRLFCVSRSRVRSRGTHKRVGRSIASAHLAGRYVPFGPYLALGIGFVLLYWNDVRLG